MIDGQVDHPLETFAGEQRSHRRPIGDVPLDEAEISPPCEAGKPGVLQADVVVIVEVVSLPTTVSTQRRRLNAVRMPMKPPAPVTRIFTLADSDQACTFHRHAAKEVGLPYFSRNTPRTGQRTTCS